MSSRKNMKTLLSAATATGYSEAIDVTNADSLILTVVSAGTSPTFTLAFYGSFDGTTFFPVLGTEMGDATYTPVKTTSTSGVAYEFETDKFIYFKVNLSAISGTGANVTVKASAIDTD